MRIENTESEKETINNGIESVKKVAEAEFTWILQR